MKRPKTTYPGVFYREAERIGGKGLERVYYIVFKKGGKVHEEKVGRQFADDMTPARAARIRAGRREDKRQSRKEIREAAAEIKWTVDRLWQQYIVDKPDTKGFKTDRYSYLICGSLGAQLIRCYSGKLVAILGWPSSTQHQCSMGRSQGFFPRSKLVYASTLGLSYDSALQGGAGLGSLSSTAVKYHGSGGAV